MPAEAAKYSCASSCRHADGKCLPEDINAAVIVVPMKRKVEGVRFFTLHKDSTNAYPTPIIWNDKYVFFFEEYSIQLRGFDNSNYNNRQRAIMGYLKSITYAPGASAVGSMPSNLVLKKKPTPVEKLFKQTVAAPVRVAVPESIDIDNYVFGKPTPSKAVKTSASIDQLKEFRAELKRTLTQHQTISEDRQNHNDDGKLPPSFEQVLEKWIPEAGRASVRAAMEQGKIGGKLPNNFHQNLENWVPGAGRESVKAMVEEGRRELEAQSKHRTTAKSLSATIHAIDEVIRNAEILSKHDKEQMTALKEVKGFLDMYLVLESEKQLAPEEAVKIPKSFEELIEECVPSIGRDRAETLLVAGLEDMQKQYEARRKNQARQEL